MSIVIEDPGIQPAYNGLCNTYWYQITNNRGHYAYLTLNVNDPNNSTNWAEWRPTIPETGYYKVEAYITSHPTIDWDCPNLHQHIDFDTSDARYTIFHVNGQANYSGNQKNNSGGWLDLGEYLFRPGTEGYVTLSDLNNETSLSTTVSFSAMRFTWRRPPPAFLYLPITGKLESQVITSTVSVLNAPALDQCHLPSTAQMQTWWNNSPYRITNIYIGGSMLLDECQVPDRTWIETVRNQGWSMIPTWIGPQAPCSGWKIRMNSDPGVAYQQGQAEADAASSTARQIGLAGSGMGGTVIYYDVENYNPADAACRNVVTSFISGWNDRLSYLGNHSGSYGGACTSYVSDWSASVPPPENLWVAAWNASRYTENAPLFNITCLPNNLWAYHQRIRQYAPGHNETYNGVTFNIDSNIADAEVVIPTRVPGIQSASIIFSSPSPELSDFGNILESPSYRWLVMNGSLFLVKDVDKVWQSVKELPYAMTIRKSFFLDKQHGWSISSSDGPIYQLFSTTDAGQTWQIVNTLPIEPDWSPESLQYLNEQRGWIAIKQQTGINFSIGRLLRTDDGGKSWQLLNLPIGAPVKFISQDIGWLAGGVSGQDLFKTQNGGISWSRISIPIHSEDYSTISLPVFTNFRNGILPIIIQSYTGTRMDVYNTDDGGDTWKLQTTLSDLPQGFANVIFFTPQIGWSLTNVGSCKTTDAVRTCELKTELWRTMDGGITWTSIEFPR